MSGCIFSLKAKRKRLKFQTQTASKLVKALTYTTPKKQIQGAMLGDGVGLGKTYTSLFTAFSYMAPYLKAKHLNAFHYTSLLIVVPSDVLLRKWRSEIEPYAKNDNFYGYIQGIKNTNRIRDKLSVMVLNVKQLRDLRKPKSSGWSVIIITYHQLKSLSQEKQKLDLLKKVTGFVIIDEAHHLRENSLQNVFKDDSRIRELLHFRSKRYKRKFLLLTATPFQKSVDQLGPLFDKHYLDKINNYDELKQYVSSVREYMAGSENGTVLPPALKKRPVIERELRKYMVINDKAVIEKGNGVSRTVYMNGERLPNTGGRIEQTIRKELDCGRKSHFELQRLRDEKHRLPMATPHEVSEVSQSPFDHDLYIANYLKYRFTAMNVEKQNVERDLQRFTSFALNKHMRDIPEHFCMKDSLLRSIVRRYFRPDHRTRHWNNKFIVFCDDVNENPMRSDRALHKQLMNSCEAALKGGLKKNTVVGPPDFRGVLEKTVIGTPLRYMFLNKLDDISLKQRWQDSIEQWRSLFGKSRLYKFYGQSAKEYYEERFAEMLRQYAGIAFLSKKISMEQYDEMTTQPKRKMYFKSLFSRHYNWGRDEYIDAKMRKYISYDVGTLHEIWDLFYKSSKKKTKSAKIEEVIDKLNNSFKKELSLIRKQWEGFLPQDAKGDHIPLVQVVKSGKTGTEIFKKFQSPLEPYAIVVGSASEEGIDLQAFTKGIIHYVFHWSPGKMVQREGRVDRIGRAVDREGEYSIFKKDAFKTCISEDRSLSVHYLLILDTYDERKYYRLRERQFLYNLLVPINVESDELYFRGDSTIKKLSFKLGVKNI